MFLFAVAFAGPGAADAADTPARSTEERLADLEAYVNNLPRTVDTNAPSQIPGPGPGHNAWQMTATALVLFMTLPGLALFYGGLVRRKNVLSVMAQCLGIAGMITILWWICGYSLTFDTGGSFLGGTRYLFFKGVSGSEVGQGSNWISNNVWAMFQLTFAIITPALIVGAIAERMKFSAVMLFIGLWMFVVYFPLAHMVWSADGLMSGALEPGRLHQGPRFCGGHRGPHVLGLVGPGAVPDPRAPPRLWPGANAAAQHGPLCHRHRHALGGLVRL